jgi:hypothetical protein
LRAVPVKPDWNPGFPIFAKESFLAAVGDDYGWIGGVDQAGTQRCVLPYTVVRRMGFRMIRFRVETIPLGNPMSIPDERLFLARAMECLRSVGDVVIPASTNAIFQTFPEGADAAPYGSYIVDLEKSEPDLWRNVERITRQNIRTAQKCGVTIRSGMEYLEVSHALIRETFRRSNLPFMSIESLERFMFGLGDNGRILVAEYQGTVQSCVVYAFSTYSAYAIYGGNLPGEPQGTAKLLHWEAIQLFKKMGIRKYDFVGARIDPRRLGGALHQGYLWRYPLRPLRSFAYSVGVRLLRGGDIVDSERHKLGHIQDTAVPHEST